MAQTVKRLPKETGMKIPNASELCGATGTLTDHGNMVQPLKTV